MSRRHEQVLFPMLSRTVPSSKLTLPYSWLWLQALLRIKGTVANGHFVEGVKFWQQQQICSFLEWLAAPLYPVTLLGYDIWRPQAGGPQHLIFTFSDSGFLYFLLDFSPICEYSTHLNRFPVSESRTVKTETSKGCF